jgi:hypothetical protein
MIEALHRKNFTAFTDLAMDFSPGVSIVINENGSDGLVRS